MYTAAEKSSIQLGMAYRCAHAVYFSLFSDVKLIYIYCGYLLDVVVCGIQSKAELRFAIADPILMLIILCSFLHLEVCVCVALSALLQIAELIITILIV